jgi:ribonucleoside-diphosphate reductase alpha chain
LHNPLNCEESVWSSGGTDGIITFCLEVPDGSKLKNQVSAIELLKAVKLTQDNWIKYGKNEHLCVKPLLSHNVSNTINVRQHEWEEVAQFIYDNRDVFCGVSLLPMSGDKDYPQAPFCAVYLPSEISREYGDGSLFVSGLIEKALELFEDNLWKACDSALGFGETIKGNGKLKWLNSCKKFATKYMGGDLKKLTYCMKDVYNWKLWLDLTRECKDIDYTQCIEEFVDQKPELDTACAGGACAVSYG